MSPQSVVEHDPTIDGWGPWTPVVMSQHGSQQFTTSVSAGRMIVSGTTADGNHRVAHLRQDTQWVDSEVRSVVWGPTAAWNGNNAQQGHLHRVREISPGLWEGIAVWTSAILDYGSLHCKAVRWTGAAGSLQQSAGGDTGFGVGDIDHVDHATPVLAHRRFNFGPWITELRLRDPQRLGHLVAGDIVSTTGLVDPSFIKTNVTLNQVVGSAGVAQVIDPASGAVSWAADAVGSFLPSGPSSQKRWCPFVLATRVVGGSASSVTVEGMRWRVGEEAPDWGDLRVQRAAVTPNAGVPAIATGPGHCGFWAAHFYNGSGGAWGASRFVQL